MPWSVVAVIVIVVEQEIAIVEYGCVCRVVVVSMDPVMFRVDPNQMVLGGDCAAEEVPQIDWKEAEEESRIVAAVQPMIVASSWTWKQQEQQQEEEALKRPVDAVAVVVLLVLYSERGEAAVVEEIEVVVVVRKKVVAAAVDNQRVETLHFQR